MRSATHLAVALVVSLLSFPPQPGWAQTYASTAERQLVDAANRERSNRRLPTLKWDAALANAARRHAAEMASHGTISHQFPGEANLPSRATKAGVRFTSLAENVAMAPSGAAVHDLWMHSPPHRANLLDKDLDSVGVGVVSRNGELFAVEDFSKAK
ncbi:MAG: CAP domain-containing protein [Terriglobales bacterium]